MVNDVRYTVVALRTQPDAHGRAATADFLGTWSITYPEHAPNQWRDMTMWMNGLPGIAEAGYVGITRSVELS